MEERRKEGERADDLRLDVVLERVLAPELELEGVTADAALQAILDKTEVPTT